MTLDVVAHQTSMPTARNVHETMTMRQSRDVILQPGEPVLLVSRCDTSLPTALTWGEPPAFPAHACCAGGGF